MNKKYTINAQLDSWLNGIYSEIKFWDNMIKTNGGIYDKNKWYTTINKNRPFVLEDDIPVELYGKNFDFIDVGSGPFSRCGFLTDKVILNHTAVDPLADAYNVLKSKAGIDTEINLKTGFVEILDKYFEPDSFDMVHMSNSLDHSFDPILGIYQLINICRIGGKVILRHKENEAESAAYEGFHQWNLSVNVSENKFIIWRDDEKYNINEIFSNYVEIKCSVDSIEPIFNRVEMIKKNEISIPDNNLYDIMLAKIYPFMIKTIMQDVLANINSPKDLFINEIVTQIETISTNKLKQYLTINNYKKIAVYGLGKIGMKLAEVLCDAGVELIIIDCRALTFRQLNTIHPDNYVADNTIDAVIITPFNGQQQLKKWFEGMANNKTIFTIDEFLEHI